MILSRLPVAVFILVAGLGLAACDEPTAEYDEVGSGDGPTEGAGSTNPAVNTSGDEEAEGVISSEQDPQ
jgi:hypothetical protein